MLAAEEVIHQSRGSWHSACFEFAVHKCTSDSEPQKRANTPHIKQQHLWTSVKSNWMLLREEQCPRGVRINSDKQHAHAGVCTLFIAHYRFSHFALFQHRNMPLTARGGEGNNLL